MAKKKQARMDMNDLPSIDDEPIVDSITEDAPAKPVTEKRAEEVAQAATARDPSGNIEFVMVEIPVLRELPTPDFVPGGYRSVDLRLRGIDSKVALYRLFLALHALEERTSKVSVTTKQHALLYLLEQIEAAVKAKRDA